MPPPRNPSAPSPPRVFDLQTPETHAAWVQMAAQVAAIRRAQTAQNSRLAEAEDLLIETLAALRAGPGGARRSLVPRPLAAKFTRVTATLARAARYGESVDHLLADLQGTVDGHRDPELNGATPPLVRQSELRHVALKGEFFERGHAMFDLLVDGRSRSISQKLGELLFELAADCGSSPDHRVAYKAGKDLEEKLGLGSNAVAVQMSRLRKVFAEWGISPEVVEIRPGGGAWRLRIMRRHRPEVGAKAL